MRTGQTKYSSLSTVQARIFNWHGQLDTGILLSVFSRLKWEILEMVADVNN